MAETPIFTKDGRKPVENLAAGDRVWATDLRTRKSGYHAIFRVFAQQTDDLVQVLTVNHESVSATPAYLFWVNAKGWVEARLLFPGEQLLQQDGAFIRVFNVIPRHAPRTKVYSFEVEDVPTSYVGKKGLLVRNAPLNSKAN